MAQKFYTAEELKELAAEYFASNGDVDHLVASTHDGVFYRPENAGYCQANANANNGQLVRVDRLGEASPLTSQPVNINAAHLVACKGGMALDIVSWFRAHLARVANGEPVETVLTDLLAEFTTDVPEAPEWADGLDESGAGDSPELPATLAGLVANAPHLPGFFSQPTNSTPPATSGAEDLLWENRRTSSTPAPASTDAPATPAVRRAYTKKATASTTAKATKATSTEKAATK